MRTRQRVWVLKRILWPCDLTAMAGQAREWAIALARLSGAELRALHVVAASLPPSGGFLSVPNPALLDPHLRPRLVRKLERLLEPAQGAEVSARPDVRVGKAAQEILRLAASLPADLVVMGAHARGRVARWFLGSVTERVLRAAPCPVLVVRGAQRPEAAPFRTILCATDFTRPAVAALRCARALARDGNAQLLVAHVVEGAPGKGPSAATSRPHGWAAVEANARAGLRAAVAEEDAGGRVRRTEEIVARGRPHEEILKLARRRKANLIVVGRGRFSVLPTFGSCARRIAEAAFCPVLVVPGK